MMPAAEDRPPADIFETSFESDQNYRTGWVQDQNGWGVDRTVQNPNEVDVIVGGVMDLPVPVGTQMLRSTACPAGANLTFTQAPPEDFFTFSALFAYEPLNPENINSKFLISDKELKFGGACFGVTKRDGAPVFFYRDGEEEQILAPGQAAEPGVFYRFECDVDIAEKSFTVRVFDHEKNALLGEAKGKILNNMRKFDNLLIFMAPTVYIDDIWIHSKAR